MIPHVLRAGTLPVPASKSTTKADKARLLRAALFRPGLSLVFLLAALAAVPASAQMTLLPSSSIVAGNGTSGYSGDNGLATSAEMNIPAGVGIDSAGNIYITEYIGCRIRKVTIATGDISTVAGTGTCANTADGGQATSTAIYHPNHRVAFDSSGNFYFAESGNNKIRKVNISTGVITTVAGNGTAGSTGDGAAATSATLNNPADVYVDSSNNLYIADAGNNKIRKVTNSTGYISTVAGNGTAGSTGDGAAATSAELSSPQTVTLDSAGNIYIGDYGNNKIRKVTISTGYISTVAGNGTAGFSGDGGAATSAELDGPYGIAFDASGNFYIGDQINHRIRMVNIGTGIISTVAGNGTSGYTSNVGPAISATMNYPNGLAMDSSGNLYIAESNNSVIRKVFLNPSFPTTALGSTSASQNVYLETTSAETLTSFTAQKSQGSNQEYTVGTITGCTVNGTTTVAINTICTVPITFSPVFPGPRNVPLAVVAGGGNINFGLTGTGTGPLAALIPGTISTVAGNGTAGSTGNGGLATSAELNGANRVAVDNAGNLYIGDITNNVVRKVTASSGNIAIVAGTGTAGYSGDSGAATSAKLNGPDGIAVDSAGNLYIPDSNNNRVRKVTIATGVITTIAGNGTCGYTGDGGLATSAEVCAPAYAALDSSNNVYIADPGNNVIRKISASTGLITTVAGTGTAGYTGNGGLATSAELNDPVAVNFDTQGNFYIAEYNNSVIRKVTVSTGIISLFAGDHTAGYSGDGGAATSAELNYPTGISLDPAGNAYIADVYSNRIRFVDASTGIITTIAGNGTGAYAGDAGAATSAELDLTTDVVLDSGGSLYIADAGNNRVRKVNVHQSPLTFATSTAVGEADSTDDPLNSTLMNIGNGTMTVSVPTSGTNPSVSSYFTLDNSTTCPDLNTSSSAGTLASGAECIYAVDFYPTVDGSVTGSAVITDNSMGMTMTQTINTTATAIAVNTTTTITSSVTPSAYGESVTFTATVAPVGGTAVATGNVQFSIDGSNVGSAVSLSSGVATYATSTLTSGTHTIGAVYAGTSNYNTSTASTFTQTVNSDDTTSSAPTTNVGTTSATQTVTVDIDTSGTLNSISVVTGGTTGLDYAYVSGGTCATGTAYTAGQTCTVKYSFTPAYPGQRLGAVLLYTSTPTLMATAYLSGTGTGPMGLFTTPTATTVSTSVSQPRGISFDGAGNLYVSGYGSNNVYKITPGGTQSTVTSSIATPRGTVVDGAGNLFVGSGTGAALYEIPAGSSTATSIATIAGGVDAEIAADSAGNIYVESTTSNNVYQIAAGTHAVTQILTGGQSVTGGTLGRSIGMAIDASNNLYLADLTNNRLYEVTYGTWAVTTLVNNDGNLNQPFAIAIDPAGNLYVNNYGNSSIVRYSAGSYTAKVLSSSVYTGYGAMAIDPSGNLYTSDYSNSSVYKYNRNATPTLSYSSTAVGLTSADQIEGFENDGNASLTFTTFAGTNASFNGTDTTCSTSSALASGSICNFGISFAPSAYGNPLTGNANITDNNLNVGGTVQQVPVSGTATADSTTTLLGSSSTPSTYGTSVTFTATVSDTTDGSLTPTGTVQFSIDGSNVGSAVTLSGGTATYATSTLTAGSHSIGAVYTPSSTSYSSSTASTFTQTVNKATPTVSAWPTASTITYGQTLASSTLSGGSASVGGTFAWTTSSTAPGAGSQSESVTFTPSDTTDYNTVVGSVTVTVNKTTPTVSAWPTASAITYGQTLASSTLTGGTASVGGTFAWTTSSTAPGAGTPSESVTFTPTDTTDYNTPATGSVSVTVNKATPTVSVWPTASAITYGQTLASSTLSGGTASVGGSFAWTTSSTAPGAGSQSESVTFTPSDTTDYNTVVGLVTVTVNKATPTVSAWPTASAITYGQTLASSTLSGGTASVGGTFAWTTSSTAPGAGTPSESVTFTPTDTTDYNTPATGSVSVTVNKATPTVSVWPTASAITYGQTLASSTLTGGTASVGGTFAWTSSSTAPGAGTPSESVTFTPSDTTDYNTTSGSVSVTVNKATPTVTTWPTASTIAYGQTLASSTLTSGTASVSGTFAWTTPTTAPSAGTPSESVTFTPTDTTDYSTVTASVPVTVNTATTSSTAPTTSVGTTSATQTVTLNITTAGTLNAISVLTGGTASLDYAYVSGGTCATGTAYTAGQTCTVKYSFTPAYPGQRLGAVLLYTSTPTLIGTAYLSGKGTGPMGLFTTPTATTLSSIINYPRGLSLDGAGNVYVSGWGNNAVYKITPGGTQSTVASSITEPGGTVIDGAGNLYIGGQGTGTLYEIPAGTTTLNSVATISGGVDNSIVADSAGNIYAESAGSNNVYQIAAGTNAVTQILTGGQSVTGGTLGRTQGMAIDASNNLYLADFTNNRLYKVTYGTWAVTTLVNNDGNLNQPVGLAIDPAGNIYVTNYGNGTVVRYSTGTYTAKVFSTLAYTGYAALAIDASGNLYTSVDSSNSVFKYNRNATPTLSYSSTAVGVASADQIEGFENDGNAALTFSAFAGTNASFNGTDTTCSTSFVLASGSTCNFGVSFQPSTTGSPLTGDANITDNTLNASSTVQQIPVSGTAGADTTSTVLSSSENPSSYSQSVTFTATVTDTSDGSLTPTGTVQFSIDGSNVGSPVTLSGGTATYATSSLSVGSHSIGAVYTSSSGNYSNSTASTFTQSLNSKATPTVTSWPTASAITYGQTLASSTLTGGSASVSGTFAWTTSSTAPGAGSPSESVTFTPTDTTDYDSPNAGSITVTVNKATPTVSVWPTASAITYGQTLAYSDLTGGTASVSGTFTWTAPSTGPLAGTPSESVTFTPSDTTDYNVPATGSVTVAVNKSSVTINGNTTLTVSYYGDNITLTYTFTGPGITPTGTTTIKDGATALGTVSLSSGVATYSTSTLAAGSHTLTAVYNGDSNYQ